jgi:malate dehydrogenase
MFASRVIASKSLARLYSASAAAGVGKVAVVGAAGGIGQPLSMLLKLHVAPDVLSLYDVSPAAPGVAADVSHCNTNGKTVGYSGAAKMDEALKDADIVVIPAGVPRKPGMSRDDLFNTNASIVKSIAEACAKNCPKACFLVISNPVNSTVPIFAEVLRAAGVYDRKRLFGVTSLDVCRANKFVGDALGVDPAKLDVPVIGGHAGITILPLLSQVPGADKLSTEQIQALTTRIQFGGDEVVKAKDGAGSATLSMAWAGAHFASRVAAALDGKTGIVECTFVENDKTPTKFFATRVELGTEGVKKIHEIGSLSGFEKEGLEKMVPELEGSIQKGVKFVRGA